MLTKWDKAWTALFGAIIAAMAEAILSGKTTPIEVITDPNAWLTAAATAFLVWVVPNKGNDDAG